MESLRRGWREMRPEPGSDVQCTYVYKTKRLCVESIEKMKKGNATSCGRRGAKAAVRVAITATGRHNEIAVTIDLQMTYCWLLPKCAPGAWQFGKDGPFHRCKSRPVWGLVRADHIARPIASGTEAPNFRKAPFMGCLLGRIGISSDPIAKRKGMTPCSPVHKDGETACAFLLLVLQGRCKVMAVLRPRPGAAFVIAKWLG